MSEFIPADFEPPRELHLARYTIRPLLASDVEPDCAAVNSSIDIIHQTRGGAWPRSSITVEEDLADLVEHEREFNNRTSFAYTIMDETDTPPICAGSIYFYPPAHSFDDSDKTAMPSNADAVVSFWPSQGAYAEGFYPELYAFVEEWLRSWPFQHPYVSNTEKPR